jgi:hypothetical protein
MKKENISKVFLEEKMNTEEENKRKKIMKEIELKTEKKVTSEILSGNITNPIAEKNVIQKENNIDILQSILFSGASEFEKKMGRQMTYSEMREMFG